MNTPIHDQLQREHQRRMVRSRGPLLIVTPQGMALFALVVAVLFICGALV